MLLPLDIYLEILNLSSKVTDTHLSYLRCTSFFEETWMTDDINNSVGLTRASCRVSSGDPECAIPDFPGRSRHLGYLLMSEILRLGAISQCLFRL